MQTKAFSLALMFALGAATCIAQEQSRPSTIPPPLIVQPDANNYHWVLMRDMNYYIGNTKTAITVPAGFVTDFASIPQGLWSFGLSPHGQYSRAAVIHDFLYWSQSCTKAQADRLLVIAMKESDVSWFDEKAIFLGVSVGGGPSWEANRIQREQKMPRIIPERFRELPPNAKWTRYQLMIKGWPESYMSFPVDPPYCAYGDSTEVPGGVQSARVGHPLPLQVLIGDRPRPSNLE